MANWTVVRAGGRVSHGLRSAMHRNFGKLFAAQGRLEEALAELARDVYHCALQVGPDHIDTTNGYFHMGSIFAAQGKGDAALAFYDKVVDCWYKFLLAAVGGGDPPPSPAQVAEADAMLQGVAAARTQRLGPHHVAVGEAAYTRALLLAWAGQGADAADLARTAHAVYVECLGADHPSSAEVAAFAEGVGGGVGWLQARDL